MFFFVFGQTAQSSSGEGALPWQEGRNAGRGGEERRYRSWLLPRTSAVPAVRPGYARPPARQTSQRGSDRSSAAASLHACASYRAGAGTRRILAFPIRQIRPMVANPLLSAPKTIRLTEAKNGESGGSATRIQGVAQARTTIHVQRSGRIQPPSPRNLVAGVRAPMPATQRPLGHSTRNLPVCLLGCCLCHTWFRVSLSPRLRRPVAGDSQMQ